MFFDLFLETPEEAAGRLAAEAANKMAAKNGSDRDESALATASAALPLAPSATPTPTQPLVAAEAVDSVAVAAGEKHGEKEKQRTDGTLSASEKDERRTHLSKGHLTFEFNASSSDLPQCVKKRFYDILNPYEYILLC